MKYAYDYLIVGAGLFGSVFAREMMDAGQRCIVIDRRAHVAGNCYTERREGIHVHMYGSHVFHTNDIRVWDYINRFARFNQFVNRVKANCNGRIFSFPINLQTLAQLWGITRPEEAKRRLAEVAEDYPDPNNAEEYLLKHVGRELMETFYRGYTEKHWMKPLSEMPISAYRRLPIRTTFDDNYYPHKYQGIPIGGYTALFERLLEGAEVRLGVDYFEERPAIDHMARKVVFTGRLDEFFEYCFGLLEYRTVDIRFETMDIPDYQGCAVVSHPMHNVAYTKSVEHKHFENVSSQKTIVSFEYPMPWNETRTPYYPLNDETNESVADKYRELAISNGKYIFGGRLAEYQYYDMHQVVGSALRKAGRELGALR
jgi:UDP-galactopyranose mutase